MAEHKTFHVLETLEASPARTRRVWSQAAKDLILVEANVPGANVSAVARAHGVSVHQVFRWRREAQRVTQIAASPTVTSVATEPAISFIEMAPATRTGPTASISTELCEIVVAGVVLRIGSRVPTKRVVELIRAARLA
jgi:transposase